MSFGVRSYEVGHSFRENLFSGLEISCKLSVERQENMQRKEIFMSRKDFETETGMSKHVRKRSIWDILRKILFGMVILVGLLYFFGRARDEPAPAPEIIYEEDCRPDIEVLVPTDANKRLCLAICDSYQISEEHPIFYIGFPEENIYDVVFTLKDVAGKELYRTNYVAPGTNTAIDGTAFLEKGSQQVECLVSVYDHDSGVLISDCTTVVLNIDYEG